jgi:membrane fusion protein (multidrug efflux system)
MVQHLKRLQEGKRGESFMGLNVSPFAPCTGERQELSAVADTGMASAAVADVVARTQLDRAVDGNAPELPARTLRERLRRPLMLAVPTLVAVVGTAVYLAEEPYASTDDAFVRAAKVTINARVAGQAIEIAVRDNERVRQGQVLFRIDPEPYQIAADQAEARLGSARLQIDSLKATYRQQQAELQSAKD